MRTDKTVCQNPQLLSIREEIKKNPSEERTYQLFNDLEKIRSTAKTGIEIKEINVLITHLKGHQTKQLSSTQDNFLLEGVLKHVKKAQNSLTKEEKKKIRKCGKYFLERALGTDKGLTKVQKKAIKKGNGNLTKAQKLIVAKYIDILCDQPPSKITKNQRSRIERYMSQYSKKDDPLNTNYHAFLEHLPPNKMSEQQLEQLENTVSEYTKSSINIDNDIKGIEKTLLENKTPIKNQVYQDYIGILKKLPNKTPNQKKILQNYEQSKKHTLRKELSPTQKKFMDHKYQSLDSHFSKQKQKFLAELALMASEYPPEKVSDEQKRFLEKYLQNISPTTKDPVQQKIKSCQGLGLRNDNFSKKLKNRQAIDKHVDYLVQLKTHTPKQRAILKNYSDNMGEVLTTKEKSLKEKCDALIEKQATPTKPKKGKQTVKTTTPKGNVKNLIKQWDKN